MPTYPPTSTPVSATAPVTASLTAPIPVPTHGPGGHFSVLAKTHIPNASPISVLSLIRDTGTWGSWNSFCPACEVSPASKGLGNGGVKVDGEVGEEGLQSGKPGWLETGTVANIDVFMNGDGLLEGAKRSRVQGVVVTVVEEIRNGEGNGGKGDEYRIAWKSTGWSHWQMHSERVMEFVDDGMGGTEYACWETFGGILASVVKATYGGTLVERFGDYAGDVRGWFEENGGEMGGKANGVFNGAAVANGSA